MKLLTGTSILNDVLVSTLSASLGATKCRLLSRLVANSKANQGILCNSQGYLKVILFYILIIFYYMRLKGVGF